MKQLVKLNKRPRCGGREFTYVLRFTGEEDKRKWEHSHDFRRTAIRMRFANGMSEYDVIRFDGHSDFSTTHKFYLAVPDDLVDYAGVVTTHGFRQKKVRFDTSSFEE